MYELYSDAFVYFFASSFSFNLGKEQLQTLNNATKYGYKNFDVTLLYSLIRNLALPSVPSPSNGWGKVPSLPSQLTIGDDIERIRDFRNSVYGHASSTAIPDHVYKGYWNSFKDVCCRMDRLYGGSVFTEKLENIEKIDSFPKVISDYIDIVNKQLQNDAFLKEELNELEGKEV